MNNTPFISLSSTKGGSGTSAVAALLALTSGVKTLVIDHSASKDLPAIFNLPSQYKRALTEITELVDLYIGDDPDTDGYDLVIIDQGTNTDAVPGAKNYFVTRKCYLALRKAVSLKFDGVIVVDEENRALTVKDVSNVIGAPIVGTVKYDTSLSRSIDAGLLIQRAENFSEGIAGVVPQVVNA